jgi:hypothetical protein
MLRKVSVLVWPSNACPSEDGEDIKYFQFTASIIFNKLNVINSFKRTLICILSVLSAY